jgi:hypothetical protein
MRVSRQKTAAANLESGDRGGFYLMVSEAFVSASV